MVSEVRAFGASAPQPQRTVEPGTIIGPHARAHSPAKSQPLMHESILIYRELRQDSRPRMAGRYSDPLSTFCTVALHGTVTYYRWCQRRSFAKNRKIKLCDWLGNFSVGELACHLQMLGRGPYKSLISPPIPPYSPLFTH